MRNLSRHSVYEFGEFVLDVDKLMLYRDETEVSLAPKVVKTLSVLVENRGEILSKDELMERVWEDAVVEESNLSQYLYLLRKTVGNRPDGTPYIETLRRRGYRFTGDVQRRPNNSGDAPHRALPLPTLIGREIEIDEVLTLLSREDAGLVTISGVGGVGKTTLARAVVDRWRGGHDIYFVELAAITRPDLVLSAIASAIGVKESPGAPLLDSLETVLQSRPNFLVLDNFEQVASAAPILCDLIDRGGRDLKVLVTSRVGLRLDAETLYVLQPLSVPVGGSAQAEELGSCESVKLFVERARALQPRFELAPTNLADVASICRRLDGLPLAIELAAARMNFMSPAAVLKRLEKQFEILKSGSSDTPKRQQTIRETIAWSYDLLPEREKQIFARLGVFAGGFDFEAAESVCADIVDRTTLAVLDGVTSLVEQNLLVARNARNGDPRVHMLEVVREFAIEILNETSDLDGAKRAHAEHFLRLGENAEPQLVAARSADWLDRLETEHDNLREALVWARENDPSIGQRLAGSIWRFWWLHGHIREACDQLDEFLTIPGDDPSIRAKLLSGATFLHRLAGNSESSRRYAEEGVELSEAAGDLRNAALSFNQLGFLALDSGDLADSERMFHRGLEKAESLGDIQILALLNNGLGELSRMKEDYDRAAGYYAKALEYNRQAGDRVRQTTCLINLGATALMRGDRESAGSFYRQGLTISSEMEDMNGTLYCFEGLAGSYWALRDPGRSALLFGAAHAGRQDNNLLLEPADKVPYDLSVSLVRESLGYDSFREKFSDGTKMSLKAATSLALEEASVKGSAKPEPMPITHGGRFSVERQGNVLRLVDWVEAAEETNESIPAPARSGSAPPARFSIAAVSASIAAVLVLGIIAAYTWLNSASPQVLESQSELDVVSLTNGTEVLAATISPDGKYFVYHEPDGKLNRIWVQQTGHATRREIVPATERLPLTMTFSPDSQYVYFVASDKVGDAAHLYRVPTLGGPVTKILSDVGTGVSFSPDGREMVYFRENEDGARYLIRSSDGSGDDRQLYPSTSGFGSSAWSPDGKWIAIVMQAKLEDQSGGCRLAAVKVETGSLIEFSDEIWDGCARIEWAPNSRGIYMIGTRAGDTMTTRRDQLFYISYPQGKSRKITSDGNRHHWSSLGVTKNGEVFAVPFNRSSQIWAVDSSGDARTAYQVTSGKGDGRAGIAPLADGRVAYIARTGEDLPIWVMNADGSGQIQLTDGKHPIEELRSGGDGRYLVFSGYMSPPRPHLFRINIDGTDLRQLTSGPTQEVDSSMSHDGKWIVYDSVTFMSNGVKIALWKQPMDSGDRFDLKRDDCQMPHFSPDDKFISCVRAQKDILILSAADGTLIQTLRVPQIVTINHSINFGARWTPDGRSVVYSVSEQGVANLWSHPIDGGEPKQLTNFSNGSIYHFAYSLDGKRLFLARGDQIRDAVLIRQKNQ